MARLANILLILTPLIVCGSLYFVNLNEKVEARWWIGTWEYTDGGGRFGLLEVYPDGSAAFGPPGAVDAEVRTWKWMEGGISILKPPGTFGGSDEDRLLRGADGQPTLTSVGGMRSFVQTPVRRSLQRLAPRADRDAYAEKLARSMREAMR